MQATGPTVEASALVTPVAFSARYDLDRTTGLIAREGHPLRGESIAGKILVAPAVQGGVAAGWATLAMTADGHGFAGMVFGVTNPVMVQGAIAAGIPIMAGVSDEFLQAARTGDRIRLDPGRRTITILAQSTATPDPGSRSLQTGASPR